MEAMLFKNETAENNQFDCTAVTELSELQLALVGGGSADVILA